MNFANKAYQDLFSDLINNCETEEDSNCVNKEKC